jgi:hypothetical protein
MGNRIVIVDIANILLDLLVFSVYAPPERAKKRFTNEQTFYTLICKHTTDSVNVCYRLCKLQT